MASPRSCRTDASRAARRLRGNRLPSDPETYPRQRGAYGYWDDHPIAQTRHWPTAAYLADRCGVLAGLVPGASTFYISHLLLVQSLEDGFNWADLLHERGIDRVTVAGLATDYCVRATALDALREGFEVTLDAAGSRGIDAAPGDVDRALDEVRAAGGEIA